MRSSVGQIQSGTALLNGPLQLLICSNRSLQDADLLLRIGGDSWYALQGAVDQLAAHQVLSSYWRQGGPRQ